MKTIKIILFIAALAMQSVLSSCKKCANCHYDDASGKEVEIGEYCGKDLENIEKNGMEVNGAMVEIHCGEH